MAYNPDKHHRRSIRLRGYDYTARGAYFITICVHGRACLLGNVTGEEMRLNIYGSIVTECWHTIPDHFPDIELDAFVAMPNHVHGIISITSDAAGSREATAGSDRSNGSLQGSSGVIVGAFKSAAAKRINELRDTAGTPVWQRNYYEHIIRNPDDLARIRAYIANNPADGMRIDCALPQGGVAPSWPVLYLRVETTATAASSWPRSFVNAGRLSAAKRKRCLSSPT